jgi:hypothetical protein
MGAELLAVQVAQDIAGRHSRKPGRFDCLGCRVFWRPLQNHVLSELGPPTILIEPDQCYSLSPCTILALLRHVPYFFGNRCTLHQIGPIATFGTVGSGEPGSQVAYFQIRVAELGQYHHTCALDTEVGAERAATHLKNNEAPANDRGYVADASHVSRK